MPPTDDDEQERSISIRRHHHSDGDPTAIRSVGTERGLRVDWDALLREAQRRLDQHVPATPERERLGILDLARASELSVQQIRLLEHHGLVQPAYEATGAKRNRRYTREDALIVMVAALAMHRLNIRPGKAAMLLLARNEDLGAAVHEAAAVYLTERPPEEQTRELPHISAGAPDERGIVRYGSNSSAARDLLHTAMGRVERVIAAHLAAIAVASLLDERELPAQLVLHIHAAPSSPASEESSGAAPPAAGDRADARRQIPLYPADHGQALGRPATSPAEYGCYLYVAPGGEVFRFVPTGEGGGDDLLADREWHGLTLPADLSEEPHRQALEVLFGIPRQSHSGVHHIRLGHHIDRGYLTPHEQTAGVAARLLSAVIEIVPEVMRAAHKVVDSGALDLEPFARRGVTALVLWLYAQVLQRLCPGMDQCDIFVPHRAPGGQPVLHLIASSVADELGLGARAMIHSDQLLSGFAFSLAQPCYVEDARASGGRLISYGSEEHARAAAALPVVHGDSTLACAYLFARHRALQFSPELQRTLEVAVDQLAEVLLQHRVAVEVRTRSILAATRTPMLQKDDALQQVIEQWVEARAKHVEHTAPQQSTQVALETTWSTREHDDRRLVAVVIGGELEKELRGLSELSQWLDEAAWQAAETFAQALDADATRVAHGHAPKLWQGLTAAGNGEPIDFTRLYRRETHALDALDPAVVAYVVVAGTACTRDQVRQLKNMVRDRGLDGRITARTESGQQVGRIYAWVLDEKGPVIERALQASVRAPRERQDVEGIGQRILGEIDTCARLLPYHHRLHFEAYGGGSPDRAILLLKDELLPAERGVYVLRHLLDLYVRAGRAQEALALAQENDHLAERMPAKWFCSLGQAHLLLGDARAALGAFEQGIGRDPWHPLPYRLAAQASLAQDQAHAYDRAEAYLRRSATLEAARSTPEDARRVIETTILLGDVQAAQGKRDAALATYEGLRVRYPQPAREHPLLEQRILDLRLRRRESQEHAASTGRRAARS